MSASSGLSSAGKNIIGGGKAKRAEGLFQNDIVKAKQGGIEANLKKAVI